MQSRSRAGSAVAFVASPVVSPPSAPAADPDFASSHTAYAPVARAPVSLVPDPAVKPRRTQRRRSPRIAGVAVSDPARTSVSDPARTYSQQEVLERLGLDGDEFARGIYERSGVRNRRLNLSEEFLAATLQERTAWIERELLERSIEAVDALGVDSREAGTVVSASLYSLGCPSLAQRLADHYEMDPRTDKYHLTGVGCAGGVPMMRLAAQALADRGGNALVVAAESMSGLTTRVRPDDARAKIVGSAIFGDGCAAALLSDDPDGRGPAIVASRVHQIPGTLDAVSLRAGEDGEDAYLHLARELPYIAGEALGGVAEEFLDDNELRREEIDHWIVHPGGRRIVENMQSALGLSDEDVALSWEALADHGNIGTPSIMYVLADTIQRREPEPGQYGLMVTIGPGVNIGLMLLAW